MLIRCAYHVCVQVHERSVDGDLLCLLARRVLNNYPSLRLILMSATMHTELYKSYFYEYNLPQEIQCLSVGARRFPIQVQYSRSLLSSITYKIMVITEAEITDLAVYAYNVFDITVDLFFHVANRRHQIC